MQTVPASDRLVMCGCQEFSHLRSKEKDGGGELVKWHFSFSHVVSVTAVSLGI